ncbi:DNA cytosine methyltransferase [Desulfotruncus arcticus]|nr:DNA (cytosine-5-)-methyltransferase [Desulfotruncus arcticus]
MRHKQTTLAYANQDIYDETEPLVDDDGQVDVLELSGSHKKLKVVSLFSGCGGLDLGFLGDFSVFTGRNKKCFEKNPYEIIWANDFHLEAYQTYKNNIGEHIVYGNINGIVKNTIPQGDIIIGGFPCQDFSISGKKQGLQADRGRLYKQMVELIGIQKPLAFLAENVKHITNDKLIDQTNGRKVIDCIVDDFENLGYRVRVYLVSAASYGVPQNRERAFIVGIRDDIPFLFRLPRSHHGIMAARQAIDDLWGKENDLSIPNHNQMSLAKFPEPKRNGNQGNYRISPDSPSQVIRSEHHMNIQGHYRTHNPDDPNDRSAWRRLTVRECARLQSFPDNFVFSGNKTQSYVVVGNAVPPILGWYMARALYKALYGYI